MIRRVLAATVLLVMMGAPVRAVTRENFLLRNGADLLALCSVSADDPLHLEAIHMCEGFAVGTFQTIMALTAYKGLEPIICPDPPPTRDEGVAHFVAWAKANPQYQGDQAVQFLGRFLLRTYPCTKTKASAGATRK
jgi:hypothetical protein